MCGLGCRGNGLGCRGNGAGDVIPNSLAELNHGAISRDDAVKKLAKSEVPPFPRGVGGVVVLIHLQLTVSRAWLPRSVTLGAVFNGCFCVCCNHRWARSLYGQARVQATHTLYRSSSSRMARTKSTTSGSFPLLAGKGRQLICLRCAVAPLCIFK